MKDNILKTMKKTISLSAMAVLALLSASCSKEGSSSAIKFKVSLPRTRAIETTTTGLENTGTFWWDGWCDGSRMYTRKTATWQSSDSYWTTGEYWPDDYSLPVDFWAYAPDAFGTIAYSDDHAKMTFTYAPSSTGESTAVDQKDLIVAYKGGNTFDRTNPSRSMVTVQFNHALAAIRYKIGDISHFGSETIAVNSITFNGFAASGNCSASTDGTFAWTPSNSKANYKQAFGNDAVATGDVLNERIDGAMLMVIPQTLTSANTMTLEWSRNGVAQPSRSKALNTSGIDLLAGKIYTFTIGIDEEKPIILDVTVEDWREEYIRL